ncbi:MAG: M15 family metallopeptidase [Propionicimonas sp.]|uniref:M15 family metallopeptidase n=1 Tax=Propionicimonas sp. TaxID=1955623 RepID=UPI003D0C6844
MRGYRLLGALGIVLSFVAGLVAGPVLGIDVSHQGAAAAAPVSVVAPSTAAAAGVASSPSATASATPTASATNTATTAVATTACRGAKDTRRTAKQKATPFTVCGIEIINSHHTVSAGYSPKLVTVKVPAYGVPSVRLQPVAAKALVAFFAAARKAGYIPVVRSSYRSYATQSSWYATMSHIYTAAPGASEHQSGLAVDLAGIENGRLVRGTTLGTSRTGKWLVRHAVAYGFILRYPTNESGITGIAFEPWHFRYVGVTAAEGVNATRTKTLERYLGVR